MREKCILQTCRRQIVSGSSLTLKYHTERWKCEGTKGGREIHLLLTTAAQVKCQTNGVASQWLVLSPQSQQVSCSPSCLSGFLQSKGTQGK